MPGGRPFGLGLREIPRLRSKFPEVRVQRRISKVTSSDLVILVTRRRKGPNFRTSVRLNSVALVDKKGSKGGSKILGTVTSGGGSRKEDVSTLWGGFCFVGKDFTTRVVEGGDFGGDQRLSEVLFCGTRWTESPGEPEGKTTEG